MTYAESVGFDPIDWREVLTNVSRKDTVTLTQIRVWSGGWPTCACGNQCALLKRDSKGIPEDPKLAQLGVIFNSQIKDLARAAMGFFYLTFDTVKIQALSTLSEIELRAHQLMCEAHDRANNLFISPNSILETIAKEINQ